MNATRIVLVPALAAGVLLAASPAATAQAVPAQRSVEQRLQIIEQQLSSQALISMLQEVRALRREVNALRGDNEVLTNKVERLGATVRELSADTERRFRELGTTAPGTGTAPDAAAPASGAVSSTAPPADATTTATAPAQPAAASTADAQRDYQAAVDQLMGGNYGGAVGAFEAFLASHGTSAYAGNAMYWLAETYYQQDRGDDALATYGRLVETHPDHAKVPEASLKSAFILDEQGKRREAVEALQNVLRDYPGSSVEPLARQRLADIQKR